MERTRFSTIDSALRHADFLGFGELVHSPDQVRNALNAATTFGEYSTVKYIIKRKMTEDCSVFYNVYFKA